MIGKLAVLAAATALASTSAKAVCPYDVNCINNPYSGRDNSSQGIPVAPFGSGPGQYNPSYAVNPDPNTSTYNPYSPRPSPNADVNEGGIPSLSKGLGLGPIKGGDLLKDWNADLLGEDRLGTRLGG